MSNFVRDCDPLEGSKSKKRSRKRSEVWEHFKETLDCKRAICKYCGISMGAESKAGTTHLKRHLELCQKRRQDVDQPLRMGIPDEDRIFGSTSEKTWDVEVKKAILTEVPFASIECKKLFSSLMGPMDVDKEIWSYYEYEKEKLANEFKDLPSRVCISYEILEEINYISITAHFINEDFKLVKKLIGFKKLTDISSESCVVQTIKNCISDWKLDEENILSFTGKDYSKYVTESLRENVPRNIQGPYFHVPCYKKGLTSIYSNIGYYYFLENTDIMDNFIKAWKAVRCQMDTFNQIATERGLPPVNEDWLNRSTGSSSDVDSVDPQQWESTVKMFKEAIPYKDVLSQYAKINSDRLRKEHEGCLELENWGCNGLEDVNLSSSCACTELSTSFHFDIDWERVEVAVKLSDKVHELIDRMASFNYPTSNLYFWNLAELEDVNNKIKNINVTSYKSMCDKILENIVDSNENLYVYFFACVLDPRLKFIFLNYYLEKTMLVPSAKEHMDVIWILFQRLGTSVEGETNELANLQEEGSTSNSIHLSNPIMDGFSIYTKEEKKKSQKTELDEYLDDELVDLGEASFNLLGWWKKNRLRYPLLCKMARYFLAIPTCVYSIRGNTSSDLRALERVSPHLAEAVICSKDWILSDEQSIPESNN